MNSRVVWWVLAGFCLGWMGILELSKVDAQIVPDRTLPINSQVTTTGNANTITGGTERGINLYHSFSQFSVPTGGNAYFNNGSLIQNILTRVTGNSASNIDGLIKANGTANLFFLNPTGITFGPNARLQIGGSFLASTANSFRLPDGSEFSATNPQAPPLLTVNLTPGLQTGVIPAGSTVVNRGHLTVGQDLTLVGDQLDVQGQLQSGRDLTLQGNQSVSVDATSTLFSGRDTIVRSPIRLLGNASYTTGGYFQTETLNGSLLEFLNPHQATIRANGDVTVPVYSGPPLYILAGGKVTTGNITITAPDTGTTGPRVIANGQGGTQTITVDSNPQGAVDIRAGVDWSLLPGGLPGNQNTSAVTPTFSLLPATGADITVGQITNSSRNVFLTNLYQSRSHLTGGTTFSWIDTSSTTGGNGGNIELTAKGDIANTDSLPDPFLHVPVALGSFSLSDTGDSGNGGNITLRSTGGNITLKDGGARSSSSSPSGNAGNGGGISFLTNSGNISLSNSNSESYSSSSSGNAGNGGASPSSPTLAIFPFQTRTRNHTRPRHQGMLATGGASPSSLTPAIFPFRPQARTRTRTLI